MCVFMKMCMGTCVFVPHTAALLSSIPECVCVYVWGIVCMCMCKCWSVYKHVYVCVNKHVCTCEMDLLLCICLSRHVRCAYMCVRSVYLYVCWCHMSSLNAHKESVTPTMRTYALYIACMFLHGVNVHVFV